MMPLEKLHAYFIKMGASLTGTGLIARNETTVPEEGGGRVAVAVHATLVQHETDHSHVTPVSRDIEVDIPETSPADTKPVAELARGKLHPESSVQDQRSDIIPQELLRKYIQYARQNCHPVLNGNTFDKEKDASLYVQLRQESAKSGGVPIAVRHVESIMRMAEAHAKMHLREYVRNDDMNAAISTMLDSFLVAQKFSVRKALR